VNLDIRAPISQVLPPCSDFNLTNFVLCFLGLLPHCEEGLLCGVQLLPGLLESVGSKCHPGIKPFKICPHILPELLASVNQCLFSSMFVCHLY